MSLLPSRARLHLDGRGAHCLDDVLIARAAAKIGRKNVYQLPVLKIRPSLQNANCEHQEAGRTKAALQRMMVHERLLHRVQLFALLQAFDRADSPPICLHGEHQA